nr:hypothetical protein [uncultured Clostridium sp.]
MGLKSLIAVAQGKNASNVSFEDKFIKEYENAVKRQEERERQPVPTDYYRPSSMYGCERMLFFMRVHGGAGAVEDMDVKLVEICNSGTDRHLRIQHLVEDMEGVETLDLEEVVKEANQRGIHTEFMGWNSDHTEARCKNEEMSIFFQPDGVLRFMGKDVILEVKTESTYQHSNRYEPKEDHKYQATCYGMGLGIDYVLFFYEDRNFCGKKAYLWKISDEMKEKVLSKINLVNKSIATGVPPEKDEGKCTYCRYKRECGLVDSGKWEHPNPPKDKKKKGQGKAKTEPKAVAKLCKNCEHCSRENIGGSYNCIPSFTAPIIPVKPNTRCKYPEKFKAVKEVKQKVKKSPVKNCCKNCIHPDNYDGLEGFTCGATGNGVRAEVYECEHFVTGVQDGR